MPRIGITPLAQSGVNEGLWELSMGLFSPVDASRPLPVVEAPSEPSLPAPA